MSLAAPPPEMLTTPLESSVLTGLREGSDWPPAILPRAVAAPVLAESTSFLKKPLFLGLGSVKPPNGPPKPVMLLAHSGGIADAGREL